MAKITLNDEVIKTMSKSKFLKQHKRLADKMNLESYYDKLRPKKKKSESRGEPK